MNETESEGNTVLEAVERALKTSGLRRDQVEVEILQEAASGFMGFGAKPARIRIREKRWAADGSAAPAPSDAPKPEAPTHAQPPRVSPRNASRSTRGMRPTRPHLPPEGAQYGGASAPPTRPNTPPEEARHGGASAPPHVRPNALPDGAQYGGASAPPPPKHAPAQANQRRDSRPANPRRAPNAPRPSPAPRTQPSPRADLPPLTSEETQKYSVEAVEFISEVLGLMGFSDAQVKAAWDPVQERIQAQIETSESERLIGREGKTLESFQYLVTLTLTRRSGRPLAVWVDTQGYWSNREKSILEQARSGIDIVKQTGKSYRLPPMEAAMRRLVHRTLMNNPEVTTASEGEGNWRKIVLRPKR